MRQDQVERLNDLAEKLADAFISEADPAEWPGCGQPPADISPQQRGDRYWCKKNAMATGGVLRYTLDLIGKQPLAGDADDRAADADMDKRISEAERRAAVAVQRALDKAAKRTFDERAVGKR